MTWPFSKTDTKLEQASSTLDPFICRALSDLEEQVQSDQNRTRILSECYVYGAIRYLASYDNMRPSSTGDLMQSMFARHFDADSNEVNRTLTFLSEVKNGEEEQLFMIEGASALRRWLVNGDRTVASDLKNLLERDISN